MKYEDENILKYLL